MLKKFFAGSMLAALALASLTSCGDSKSSGTGEFATVYAVATPPSADLDSDVVRWTDATNNAVSACTAGSSPTIVAKDVVNYTITSRPYTTPNTGASNPTVTSDLVITKVTLKLTPGFPGTSPLPPKLQTQYLTSGQLIVPGSNIVPVDIVSTDLKLFIADDILGLSTACNNEKFTYRAEVSFEAKEVNTDRVATITAPGFFLIHIGDYVGM